MDLLTTSNEYPEGIKSQFVDSSQRRNKSEENDDNDEKNDSRRE